MTCSLADLQSDNFKFIWDRLRVNLSNSRIPNYIEYRSDNKIDICNMFKMAKIDYSIESNRDLRLETIDLLHKKFRILAEKNITNSISFDLLPYVELEDYFLQLCTKCNFVCMHDPSRYYSDGKCKLTSTVKNVENEIYAKYNNWEISIGRKFTITSNQDITEYRRFLDELELTDQLSNEEKTSSATILLESTLNLDNLHMYVVSVIIKEYRNFIFNDANRPTVNPDNSFNLGYIRTINGVDVYTKVGIYNNTVLDLLHNGFLDGLPTYRYTIEFTYFDLNDKLLFLERLESYFNFMTIYRDNLTENFGKHDKSGGKTKIHTFKPLTQEYLETLYNLPKDKNIMILPDSMTQHFRLESFKLDGGMTALSKYKMKRIGDRFELNSEVEEIRVERISGTMKRFKDKNNFELITFETVYRPLKKIIAEIVGTFDLINLFSQTQLMDIYEKSKQEFFDHSYNEFIKHLYENNLHTRTCYVFIEHIIKMNILTFVESREKQYVPEIPRHNGFHNRTFNYPNTLALLKFQNQYTILKKDDGTQITQEPLNFLVRDLYFHFCYQIVVDENSAKYKYYYENLDSEPSCVKSYQILDSTGHCVGIGEKELLHEYGVQNLRIHNARFREIGTRQSEQVDYDRKTLRNFLSICSWLRHYYMRHLRLPPCVVIGNREVIPDPGLRSIFVKGINYDYNIPTIFLRETYTQLIDFFERERETAFKYNLQDYLIPIRVDGKLDHDDFPKSWHEFIYDHYRTRAKLRLHDFYPVVNL